MTGRTSWQWSHLLLLVIVTSSLLRGKSHLTFPSIDLILGNNNVGATTTSSSNIQSGKLGEQLMVVTFVNGIYHSVEDWQRISNYLKDLFDVEVYPFYNPSSGSWMKDATKAGFELVTRPNDLALAKQLAEHLRTALSKVGENGRVLHIAHSGGAILTYLAAKHHLTISETSRIDVATFGAGKSITHKYFKGRLCNYYSRNDPLTLIDKRVNKLLKQLGNGNNDDLASIRDHKHNTSFVFLAAVHNHPVMDHSMEGEPYRKALDLEAYVFKSTMEVLRLAKAKETNVIRNFRKRTAHITGLHHFWDNYVFDPSELFFRRVRKASARVTGRHGYFSGKQSSFTKATSQSKEMVEENIMFQPIPQSQEQSATVAVTTCVTSESQPSTTAAVHLDQLQFQESV